MTNTQLYLSIGIPSILVILAWIHSITRISRLESTTDSGLSDLRENDKRIIQDVGGLRDIVYGQMIDLHSRLSKVEERTK